MKVIVTGGSGFIGSHVCERLVVEHGCEVIVFDHRGRGDNVFLGDIKDPTDVSEAFGNADAFIHLAGVLGTQECIQNPRPAVETNIIGGINVLEAAARLNVPGVCIGVGNHFMQNTYSITKSTIERFVAMYNAERGTRINVVRAMNVYGPRQTPAVPYGPSKVRKIAPSFICRALRGDDIEVYGGGEQISDMVYVSDLAKALCRAMVHASAGNVFDKVVEVGPSVHTTVIQVAETVKRITGSSSRIVPLPRRPGEQMNAPVYADTETMKLVGMAPEELVPLEAGLELAIDYYRTIVN